MRCRLHHPPQCSHLSSLVCRPSPPEVCYCSSACLAALAAVVLLMVHLTVSRRLPALRTKTLQTFSPVEYVAASRS